MMATPPVLFLIFNRPQETADVFERIRKQAPARLYIAADGPRPNIAGEQELCEETKRQVLTRIDWDCEVKTLLRQQNLGCKNAVWQAISWFFEQEEMGIILEDDCLPTDSFFTICAELLLKHKYNTQVMMIGGTSYQAKPMDVYSYYYSTYMHIWGWASWRRAWQYYNAELNGFDETECLQILAKNLPDKREQGLWRMNLQHIINGFDTWDYQWQYSIWKNNGLTIIPWKNCITNIGFGPRATHTFATESAQARLKSFEITGPIKHPNTIQLNKKADRYERYTVLLSSPAAYFLQRALQPLKNIIKRVLRPYFNITRS